MTGSAVAAGSALDGSGADALVRRSRGKRQRRLVRRRRQWHAGAAPAAEPAHSSIAASDAARAAARATVAACDSAVAARDHCDAARDDDCGGDADDGARGHRHAQTTHDDHDAQEARGQEDEGESFRSARSRSRSRSTTSSRGKRVKVKPKPCRPRPKS